MLCILIFIIFLILFPIFGIFSKDYRVLFRKSWSCVFKRVTLQPCDINLGEEIKNKMLGKIIFRYPQFGKFLDKTASFWAFLFVVISVGSLLYSANAGLNLWVYGTCNPRTGESCSLSGEACGVSSERTPTIFETIERIPDKLKNWVGEDYVSPTATYYLEFDSGLPTAVEIIDPSCNFCKKLWGNVKEAKFYEDYNLTYVLYPIPEGDGYKFNQSYLLASYLEALKIVGEPERVELEYPADWLLLDKIFQEEPEGEIRNYQNSLNLQNEDTVKNLLREILREIGYSDEEIDTIEETYTSEAVKSSLEEQRRIVEEEVKTIRIPTIIFDGDRYDRVLDVGELE